MFFLQLQIRQHSNFQLPKFLSIFLVPPRHTYIAKFNHRNAISATWFAKITAKYETQAKYTRNAARKSPRSCVPMKLKCNFGGLVISASITECREYVYRVSCGVQKGRGDCSRGWRPQRVPRQVGQLICIF